MFKNVVKAMCCILTISSMVMSQQGKYVRKSVSSLESVWFKPGSVGGGRRLQCNMPRIALCWHSVKIWESKRKKLMTLN